MTEVSRIHLARKVQSIDSGTAIPEGDRWWLEDEIMFPVSDLFEPLGLKRGELIPQDASWLEQIACLSGIISRVADRLKKLESDILEHGDDEDARRLLGWADVFNVLVEGLSSLSSVGISTDRKPQRDYFVSIIWG